MTLIEQMKKWCEENYTNGADTMVECWEDEDYQQLIDDCNGNEADAWECLRRVAAVFEERQADARFHANS